MKDDLLLLLSCFCLLVLAGALIFLAFALTSHPLSCRP